MNDESKRIFSEIRRTVTWDKERIKIEIIELRECLKYWKKNGILKSLI
jgi:hypothetical protein